MKRTVRQNRTLGLYYCRFSIGFWSKVLFQTLLYSYCWRHGKYFIYSHNPAIGGILHRGARDSGQIRFHLNFKRLQHIIKWRKFLPFLLLQIKLVLSSLQITLNTTFRTLQNTCKRGSDVVQWEIKDAPHINCI